MAGYESSSLIPLPDNIRHGMIAMGIFGLLSTISTLSLLSFITYRMIYWRRYYQRPLARNQIFVLIYNLLLADIQQALAFLLAFHWISQDRLVGPSTTCFIQGWLIQTGDLSSGLWVFAIAVHTFINLVGQKHIPMTVFIPGVIAIWFFVLILAIVGPIMHGTEFFVPAGAWCWINETHETDRLTLHYIWIFMSQLGSLVIYTTIFFYLRTRVATSGVPLNPNTRATPVGTTTTTVVGQTVHDPFQTSRNRIMRTARYMVVYPIAYVTLTLPLAAGRVSAMANKNPTLVFYCVAGSMMASCGMVDVALYIWTRKALIKTNVGIKGSQQIDRSLDGRHTFQANRSDAGADSYNLGGMEGTGSDDSIEEISSRVVKGAIMVSKTVIRSEDSFGHLAESSTRQSRPESLKSLVTKDEGRHGEKSWLA